MIPLAVEHSGQSANFSNVRNKISEDVTLGYLSIFYISETKRSVINNLEKKSSDYFIMKIKVSCSLNIANIEIMAKKSDSGGEF